MLVSSGNIGSTYTMSKNPHFDICHVALESVSEVEVTNESITLMGLMLSWMDISMTSSNFRYYIQSILLANERSLW